MSETILKTDVLILGAGAAGLMAAIEAAKRRKKVLVLESNSKLCEKIRISGGGRCNFTNLNASAENYISQNPHFIKSALNTYNQFDFIKLVEKHRIKFHEKKLGQLFCDEGSQEIINMLLKEADDKSVQIIKQVQTEKIHIENPGFKCYAVSKADGKKLQIETSSLIIATGGLSIPQIGANDFGYRMARNWGLNIIEPKPGLVPLMSEAKDLDFYKQLSGTAIDSIVTAERQDINIKKKNKISFRENILFTHRGLSGPAILQISSYTKDSDYIHLNLIPETSSLSSDLKKMSKDKNFAKKSLANILKLSLKSIPESFLDKFAERFESNLSLTLGEYPHKFLDQIQQELSEFRFKRYSSEGFLKAEVSLGGIDTNELKGNSMEVKKIPKLFFIGELVDITGWLGGYNFQWAWSSAYLAGQNC